LVKDNYKNVILLLLLFKLINRQVFKKQVS